MPVKRRAPKNRNIVVTPELLAAYKRHRELDETGCTCAEHKQFSPPPPICAVCTEQHELRSTLYSLTDGKPWQPDIFQVYAAEPDENDSWRKTAMFDLDHWRGLWDLKQELEKALRK